MSRQILTVNAGSSSLKFALFDAASLNCTAIGALDGLGTDPNLVLKDGDGSRLLVDTLEGDRFVADHAGALRTILAALDSHIPGIAVVAVGHRVVHGGLAYSAPVAVDEQVLANLAQLIPLAPLHQPHNLAGIEGARVAFPEAVQVACFDTAFHRGHDFVTETYAIPRTYYDEGVRRYGFHGLSYEYVARRLAEIEPGLAKGRVVICHLGSGASMCALAGGKSVASTMGFSALDGLPMGTRPGQIDPGVLLYLMDQKGMDARAISDLLYKESGLKGLSGISNDMRDLEASDDPRANQAIDYFAYRIRREIGAMAAVLGGLDAIVFCGGIGENSRLVRQSVLQPMEWLGVAFDSNRNRDNAGTITTDRSAVRGLVIPTNEELMIARHTRQVVDASALRGAA